MDDLLVLKQALFNEYDGFADKRYKKLDNNKLFMIDDRSPGDYGANGQLISSVCPMFASVESDERVRVVLRGNVPQSQGVKKWCQKHKAKLASKTLEFDVTPESIGMLDELARTIESIVAAGAYKVPSYKYVCPRVANSLRRLAKVLRSL